MAGISLVVGNAVATMVWLSAARNIASVSPSTMVRISPWLSTQRPGCGPDGGETGLFCSGIPSPASCPATTPPPGPATQVGSSLPDLHTIMRNKET